MVLSTGTPGTMLSSYPRLRRLATILRETADLRAHYWRYEVSGTGWTPLPHPPVVCSCCSNFRVLKQGPAGARQVRWCPECDRLVQPMVEV